MLFMFPLVRHPARRNPHTGVRHLVLIFPRGVLHPVRFIQRPSPYPVLRLSRHLVVQLEQGFSPPRPLLLPPGTVPPGVQQLIIRSRYHHLRVIQSHPMKSITLHQSSPSRDGNIIQISTPYSHNSEWSVILKRTTASRIAPVTVGPVPSFYDSYC